MQGLKCKITDEIGKAYRFHCFSSFQLKLEIEEARAASSSSRSLLSWRSIPPAAGKDGTKMVWCPDQSDGRWKVAVKAAESGVGGVGSSVKNRSWKFAELPDEADR